MACEDFPCCGHESGCCPDRDPDTGEPLNMKCTCGAPVPLSSRFSLCDYHLGIKRSRYVDPADPDAEPTDEPAETCSDPNGLDDGHGLGEQPADCDACELYHDDHDEVDLGDYEFERYGYDYPED